MISSQRSNMGSLDAALNALQTLNDRISQAPNAFLRGDKVALNRVETLQLLDAISTSLPDALRQAKELIRTEASIREQAETEANQLRTQLAEEKAQAQAESSKILADAKSEAERLKKEAEKVHQSAKEKAEQETQGLKLQAQKDAEQIILSAQVEARHIVEDAQMQARAAVSKENVLRQAQVQADEELNTARTRALEYQQSCIQFCDKKLAETDMYLQRQIEIIRQYRQKITNT